MTWEEGLVAEDADNDKWRRLGRVATARRGEGAIEGYREIEFFEGRWARVEKKKRKKKLNIDGPEKIHELSCAPHAARAGLSTVPVVRPNTAFTLSVAYSVLTPGQCHSAPAQAHARDGRLRGAAHLRRPQPHLCIGVQ